MLLKILMLFLSVNFSHGEHRRGLGIFEHNGNFLREGFRTNFLGLPSRSRNQGNENSSSVIHFPSERHEEKDGNNSNREETHYDSKYSNWGEPHKDNKYSSREEPHKNNQNSSREEPHKNNQNSSREEPYKDNKYSSREEPHKNNQNSSREEPHKDNKNSSREEPHKNNHNSNREVIPRDKCGLDVPRRIIGGSSTDIDEFPWLCLLQYVNPSGEVTHDCSGVLISKRYVLTAAHCTHGLGITTRKLKLRKVRLGEWDTSSEKDCQGDVCSAAIQEIEVEDIIPHEKYKPRDTSQVNDIALIRLKQEANLNQYVQPICLPFDKIGNTDYEGKKLTVSGWGRTSNARNSASNIKMKVDLPVTSWENCRQFYDSYYGGLKISGSQFCAGGEDGKDSCQGDSGGPLMTTERTKDEVKWFIIGIVSSGPAACAVQGRPSLYTNVSQFTDWISNNIKN